MARGINIDDLIRNLSFREKKELNDALGDNGIENGKDLIDAFKHMFSDGGGFSDSREKGLFGKLADQKSEYNEAKRLLKSLEEFKKGGVDGMTHKEDAELLKEMGLDLDNMEESSRELAKNLKDVKFDNNFVSRVNTLSRTFSDINRNISSMGNEIEHVLKPWAEANKAASDFSKHIGMSGAGMKALTDNTINNVVKSKIGIDYNMSTDDVIKAQEKYVQSVGRNLRIDDTQQTSLAAMTAVMGDRSTELAAAFENFGVNLNTTAEHSGKMFDKAAKRGISFEKLTDNVAKNIKIAQNYTFKNGLKGLESMAAKAVALKMDMAQVASLADKVSSVEGSIDVASKLQVLGGPFASMADPLAMMNEGLNDMEGLMDRVTKMVGGLGSFDKNTGEVKVSSFNRKRVQAAAQAMGVDYSTLMESVNAQAKRESIKREIKSSANASALDKDMQELLMNTATFDTKTGKYGVSIGGKTKTLDELENSDYKQLIKETQSESDDIKDIAKILRSHFDKTKGVEKQKEANQAQMTKGIGGAVDKIIDFFGQSNGMLKTLVGLQMAASVMSMVSDGMNIARSFRGGGMGSKTLRNLKNVKIPKAQNVISKTAAKGVTETTAKVGADAAVKAGGETAMKAGSEVAAKAGAETAAKVGGKGLGFLKGGLKGGVKGIGVGLALGAGAAGMDMLNEHLLSKGTIKEGGFANGALSIGSKAMEGAAWGSALGVPGMVAGAAIGTIVGATQFAKQKRQKALDNQLGDIGIERKGDYGAHKLKLIEKGLQTGELSDRMRRRLLEQGDTELLKQIDAKKAEIEEKEEAKKDRVAQRKAMMKGEKGEKAARRIKNANFIVSNAYFSKKGFGVESIGAKLNPLNPIVPLIKGVAENGFNAETLKMQKNAEKRSPEKSVYENPVFNGGKLDVNISGTIKIEANGKQFNMDELMKDQGFKQELAKLISNQISQNNTQSNRNEKV